VLAAPLALAAGLVLLSFGPRVAAHPALARSYWGAAVALVAWQAVLYVRLRRARAGRSFELVLRPQHYLQATVQLAVFAYWGYHWRPVYDFAPLLVGQLVFAYAFDMLLAWSRRERYVLGFGPFPIIFSINLFLWFQDQWFALQLVMIAVGFLGKELVRWRREGRLVHVFNPSAFALGLFSLALIVTGTTELTWAQEIATTLTRAPQIYLFLFLLGLVVMAAFSITLVAGSAAIVLFAGSALHSAATGVPYFVDSEIPAAVFLGLHLLVTDPSTSPRTSLGKVLFGALYGLGVLGLYALLGAIGAPTFYDKLLCVPLLNLGVRRIDALARGLERIPALGRWGAWAPGRANAIHMTLWILFFGSMTARGATDGLHRGETVPFWQGACAEGRRNACQRLVQIESTYCADQSGWACNELGAHLATDAVVEPDAAAAWRAFAQGCELRYLPACFNLLDFGRREPGESRSDAPEASEPSRSPPRILDLRLLLREGGPNLLEMPEPELLDRACRHGWSFACGRGAR
jgi:Na+-translocating ferredoxin:NAD+ oxidoreductase RnfD subunit